MPDRRAAYLDAIGIDQWVLRSSAPEVVEPVVEASNADKPAEPVLEQVSSVPEQAEAPPAFTFQAASLPSFPAQSKGQFCIVCAEPTGAEGEGSAFEGDVATLFSKMLGATHWPAEQCVLLDTADDFQQVIEATKAKIVVAMGEQAVQALFSKNVEQSRQTAYPHSSGALIFATHHPVAMHNNPAQLKRPLWEDLKLAMAEAAKL